MTPLRHEALELGDETADGIPHLREQFAHRLDRSDLRFVERYRKRECHLLAKFAVDGLLKEWVASFEYLGIGGINENLKGFYARHHLWSGFPHLRDHHRANVDGGFLQTDRQQEAMLIGVVQDTDLPKDLASTSLVRLACVECLLNSRLRQSYYYTSRVEGAVILGVAVSDRVLDRLTGLRRDCCTTTRSRETQGVGEMVQGTSEIVNDVSCHHGVIDRNDGIPRQVIRALTGIRVLLQSDNVAVGLNESVANTLKLREVMLGPIDFRPDAEQRSWWHDLSDGEV